MTGATNLRTKVIRLMAVQNLRFDAGSGPDDPASQEWAEQFFAENVDAAHIGDCEKAEVVGPGTCARCVVDEAVAAATAALDSLYGEAYVVPTTATSKMSNAAREHNSLLDQIDAANDVGCITELPRHD